MLLFIFRRILIFILVSMFIGWLLCDIDPIKSYSWYHGIWHGMFFIPNLIRSWFGDALYKANFHTSGYNVWWWIMSTISVISSIFGGNTRNQNYY